MITFLLVVIVIIMLVGAAGAVELAIGIAKLIGFLILTAVAIGIILSIRGH